jgi:hypothetical protein
MFGSILQLRSAAHTAGVHKKRAYPLAFTRTFFFVSLGLAKTSLLACLSKDTVSASLETVLKHMGRSITPVSTPEIYCTRSYLLDREGFGTP